jgi:hypothetical protein
MKELTELQQKCFFSITIRINNHRDNYEDVRTHFQNIYEDDERVFDDIAGGAKTLNKMIELDTIIEVQAYPESGNCFQRVYHYDITEALKAINELI